MAIRAISQAMKTAQSIAESPTIPEEHKTVLAQKVLEAGASATAQPLWDNWAQRLVAGGLTVIGIVLAVFIGIAILKKDTNVNQAYTAALTATIGGLAGMFTQKALSGGAGNGGAAGGGGAPDGGGAPSAGSPGSV